MLQHLVQRHVASASEIAAVADPRQEQPVFFRQRDPAQGLELADTGLVKRGVEIEGVEDHAVRVQLAHPLEGALHELDPGGPALEGQLGKVRWERVEAKQREACPSAARCQAT